MTEPHDSDSAGRDAALGPAREAGVEHHAAGDGLRPGDAGAAAEWATRYRDYVERSIARASRTQDLNRDLIKRVASGELAPWTIESHYATFAATHAAAYAQRMAEVTMTYLAGLVQMGSTYSYELVEAVLPGAATLPEMPPPSFDPSSSADWFADLTTFAAAENRRVTEMLRRLMEKVAMGELTPANVEEVSSRFHSEHVPASTSRLVELYLDLLTGLEEVHGSFGEQYLRTIPGLAPATGAPSGRGVEVVAALGQSVSVRFAVANTDLEPAAVRCSLTGVRRADGVGPAFDPIVGIRPEQLDLPAGSEEVVELTVHTDGTHFQAGSAYEGVFRVANDSRTLLELPLTIHVTPPRAPAESDEDPDEPARAPGDEADVRGDVQ
jgi:hypothetical protein